MDNQKKEGTKPVVLGAIGIALAFLICIGTVFLLQGCANTTDSSDGSLTDKELALMEEVDSELFDVMQEAENSFAPDATEEEKSEERYIRVKEYLENAEKDKKVSNVLEDKENYTITFEYAGTGVSSGAMCGPYIEMTN